ncbi:MAG: hypothetical protein KDK61_07795, partial [Simkania sp.]|nr:hypothetical protein [Simkania sp.]
MVFFSRQQVSCGIAGFLDLSVLDSPLDQFKQYLQTTSLENQGIKSFLQKEINLEQYGGGLDFLHKGKQLCQELTTLTGRTLLKEDPALQKAVQNYESQLSLFLEEEEQVREKCATQLSLKENEKINQVLIQLKDIQWQVKIDILGNLPKIESLAHSSTKAYRHYARINAILNTIDRLEIRGRDSAGIGLQIRFKTKPDYQTFVQTHQEALETRSKIPDFSSGSIRLFPQNGSLHFVFKTAKAVGRLGENVQHLRQSIEKDPLLQEILSEKEITFQVISHTRWASNGVISEPNCHPINNEVQYNGLSIHFPEFQNSHYPNAHQTHLQVVLNGDIDNYQQLRAEFEKGLSKIAPAVTTDAKIITLQIQLYLAQDYSLQDAFRLALN